MARAYLDKISAEPLLSVEQGVGEGMMNETNDVCLVQLLLWGALTPKKIYLAGNTVFTPPAGQAISVTGIWDAPSAAWLAQFEVLMAEARGYWAHGVNPETQYPGRIVPFKRGGKKIRMLNSVCTVFWGARRAMLLDFGMTVPDSLWNQLYWDPVRFT